MAVTKRKSSRLYRSAKSRLSSGEDRSTKAFEKWLSNYDVHRSPPTIRGGRIRGNLQREAHLTGDDTFGTPDEFASFLKRCGIGHSHARSVLGRHTNYEDACREFE